MAVGQVVPFAPFVPDLADTNANYTRSALNVLPRADGYGPFPSPEAFTTALPAGCRGYFFARYDDELIIFAATSTRLYKLDNTALEWTDVSKGGVAYSECSPNEHWQFAQFNEFVIAVQGNVPPQIIDIVSGPEFDDLAGSPPQSRYISIINRFVVLSGLPDDPYRVHWSALNDVTGWTPGTGLCDFQDLPDGGQVRGVVGGEFGIIIQDGAMRRMVFSPGSDVIFQIDRISKDTGTIAPYSIVDAGGRVFFLSLRGFVMSDASGSVTPIGKERVDRTFLADLDPSALGMVLGAADPSGHVVVWSYKSASSSGEGFFDKLLAYDWVLDRWSLTEVDGTFLAALARPGLTLDGLDFIGASAITGAADNGSGLIRLTVESTADWADGQVKNITDVTGTTEANGYWTITVIDSTHIDLQGSTFSNAYVSGGMVNGSLDDLPSSLDAISSSTLPKLSLFDEDARLGFFSGAPLEATLETAEIADHGWRTLVNGFTPLTDAETLAASLGSRMRLNVAATYTPESAMNDDGFAPLLGEGRYIRGKVRIPADTTWTYATGLSPDAQRAGRY